MKVSLLGTISGILSIIYIVLFFLFGSHDFGFFSQKNASLVCILYGLSMFFIGVWMTYISVGKEELHETMKDLTYSSKNESLLDDLQHQEENKRNKFDVNSILAINLIHLFCCLFLITGQYVLGYSYAAVVVLGFVYAICWIILGFTLFLPELRAPSKE